ncbi:hypothetical protein BV22DRAFT_1041906 [Leucogyrophana mollusca]|uniref:Uncharacterized protein n=1 Tax=Leucogyrophana mollusca TaxID=85980 RepID=A0ACB8AXU8_9AGAM|nr:hypothetical protein BV22DRAFT_1041906 [Leucogyrophana mollusca]
MPKAKGRRGREHFISTDSRRQIPAGVHHDPTRRRPCVKGCSVADDTGYCSCGCQMNDKTYLRTFAPLLLHMGRPYLSHLHSGDPHDLPKRYFISY